MTNSIGIKLNYGESLASFWLFKAQTEPGIAKKGGGIYKPHPSFLKNVSIIFCHLEHAVDETATTATVAAITDASVIVIVVIGPRIEA